MRLLICALVGSTLAWTAERTIEFNRDVRPILSDKCFTCHGPDAASKKVPVRLDSEAAARPVIAKILPRITSDKKFMKMPPPTSGLQLSPAEVTTLSTWIEQGAPWQKHWSFLPPQRAEVPAGTHPIDYFVRQRLTRENLPPAPEAPRATLLRRVTFDLIGLPPTPAELEAFLKDSAPNAYEKVVDRLLTSPHYGERMAARWLDAARYADTNGYQYDAEREMWRWRDWVIEAFNRNKRFDQFTVEQIAGDLLPNATRDQIIATGFNRNHRANTEDGIVPAEYAVEYVVDRVETTSTVFMGLTLGCARCHNHKYDPLTQKEFYQFYAYFNNIPERGRAIKFGNSPPLIPAPTKVQQNELAQIDERIGAIERFLRERQTTLAKAAQSWQATLPAAPAHYDPTAGELKLTPKPEGNVTFEQGRAGQAAIFDGKSALNAGSAAAFDISDRFTLSAWVYSDTAPEGAIVTKMADNPQGKGYGIYANQGRLHVHLTSVYADDALRIDTIDALTPGAWHNVLVTYDGISFAEHVKIYVDGQLAKVKVTEDSLYRPFRNNNSKFDVPLRIGAGGGPKRHFQGKIDDVRIFPRVVSADEIAILAQAQPLQKLPSNNPAVLRAYLESTAAAPEVRQRWQQLSQLRLDREKLDKTFPTVMVMAEKPQPQDTFLLVRGAYDKPGDKVERGVPAVLPALATNAPNNRLGLAQWMISKENPLLARVTVNRFWQSYFGTGLVKTTEDFGVQGEWPSHPELLDWLATEFVRTGWDVKAMQKLIVTSATYKQSSRATPELIQRDPENRLLARGPRFRLSAEMIRDQALADSGLLNETIGGRSVKPYQPAGLWKEITMQGLDYDQDHGRDLYRRSLYTFWKRTVAPPVMANFDSANRESCVVRETRTNTPLQALNLMNDVTFLEASRFIGQRMLKEGGRDPLGYGFRLITSRAPSPAELAVLQSNLQYHRDYFAANPAKVAAYLKQGETPADPSLNPADLAAHAAVASLILNLDEAVTKE